MVFSSLIFLCLFLPAFLILYLLSPDRFKNITALLFSLLFYAWGAPGFLVVLQASITLDMFLVKWMGEGESAIVRKRALIISMLLNVGLLAYFKYANFFVGNVNEVLQAQGMTAVHWTKVALPIGISFFTFQKISYVVDVHRGDAKPLKNWWDLALYIMLFPQLIAGPIVRYNEIADQLHHRKDKLNASYRFEGMFRFVIGLAKKVIIANAMASLVDPAFDMGPEAWSSSTAWLVMLAYTWQIYYDFSGYSDMAIGLGMMMGFRFPENFDFPYIARSITEFWRRWHLTLSHWMRDYLYIPLGGNRKGPQRTCVNLWLVFLFSGLWHGAAWNFVIWGAYHGLFLVVERLGLLKLYKRIGHWPALPLAFLIVVLGWVLFRVESLHQASIIYSKLFYWESGWSPERAAGFEFKFGVAAVFALLPAIKPIRSSLLKWFNASQSFWQILFKTLLGIVLLTICLSELANHGYNPFIYYRF